MTDEIPGVNMADLRLKGFRVHALQASQELPLRRGRRDFYKMGLVNGDLTVQYGGELLELKGTVLFFCEPESAAFRGQPRQPHQRICLPVYRSFYEQS